MNGERIKEGGNLMRLKAFAICILAGFGTSVAAKDSTQTLQQALKQIPEVVLSHPEAMQIFFLDAQVWRGLGKSEPSADGMRRLAIARPIRPVESIGYSLDRWSANARISFDDLSYFAGFGQAPLDISYWGPKDKASVGKLVASLKRADFASVDGDVSGVIANDGADKTDLKKVNPEDPWRGIMGKASFVLSLDTVLIQASSAAGMELLAQPTPSVADSEVVTASVAGLKEGVPSDRGQIVQAVVISPILGLTSVDPAKVLLSANANIDIAKQNLRAAVEASGRGIPPYFSGIIADAQIDNLPAVVISLSYADCATAKQAVNGIGAAWKESMAGAVDAKVSGRTVEAGKLCAAVISLTSPEAENAGNPVLSEIMDRYMLRDFTLLQIGRPR